MRDVGDETENTGTEAGTTGVGSVPWDGLSSSSAGRDACPTTLPGEDGSVLKNTPRDAGRPALPKQRRLQ
jgi:hypothetical protein